MVLWHFLANFLKDLSKNEVSKNSDKYRTPSKKLVIALQKHGAKNSPVGSFASKYYCRAAYCLNGEAIFLLIG